MKLSVKQNYKVDTEYLKELNDLFSIKLYEYNFNPIKLDPIIEITLYSKELSNLLWKSYDFVFINLVWRGINSPINQKRKISSAISKTVSSGVFSYNVEIEHSLCKFEIINIENIHDLEQCIRISQNQYFFNPGLLIANLNSDNITKLLQDIYFLTDDGIRINFKSLSKELYAKLFEKVYFMNGDIDSGTLRVLELE